MARKPVKRSARKKAPVAKIITVAVMGRDAREIPLTTNTSADEVARRLGISYASVQASKNGRTNFSDIKSTDLINGYGALLFTPAVDGGQ